MDDLRGDFHHSEQGRSSCPCHNKNPIFVVFLCCGYSAVAVLVDISVMGITISASCPPANAILRYREYQQVTAATVPASSTDK
ncbi:TPA: hypothetical protein ACH9TF_001594, partial [Escherichia coli]